MVAWSSSPSTAAPLTPMRAWNLDWTSSPRAGWHPRPRSTTTRSRPTATAVRRTQARSTRSTRQVRTRTRSVKSRTAGQDANRPRRPTRGRCRPNRSSRPMRPPDTTTSSPPETPGRGAIPPETERVMIHLRSTRPAVPTSRRSVEPVSTPTSAARTRESRHGSTAPVPEPPRARGAGIAPSSLSRPGRWVLAPPERGNEGIPMSPPTAIPIRVHMTAGAALQRAVKLGARAWRALCGRA